MGKNILVGCDQSGAQMKLLAHFLEDEAITNAVCYGSQFEEVPEGKGDPEYKAFRESNWYEYDKTEGVWNKYLGTDVHSVAAVAFLLVPDDWEELLTKGDITLEWLDNQRSKAKNGEYCCIFGGQGPKLAETLGIPAKEGVIRRESFLAGFKLDSLLSKLEEEFDANPWKGGGFITTLGGTKLWSNSKHKLLNFTLQGAEAVIQKEACRLMFKRCMKEKLPIKQIFGCHDELLFECPVEYKDICREYSEWMYKQAAIDLGVTVPYGGDSLVGDNYLETH